MMVAEVAPAAPILVEATAIAGFLVALGLCYVAIYFCRALFGTAGSLVGWIPWVGHALQGSLSAIEQKLTNELGKAAAGLDNRIAHMWHRLAGTTRWLAHEIAANAGAILSIASVLSSPLSIPAWARMWNQLLHRVDGVKGSVPSIVKTVVRPIEHTVTKVVHVTTTQTKVVTHTVGNVIAHDLPGLRHRVRVAEDDAVNALKRTGKLERRFAGLAFAGAVAIALARLGASWIRCNNVSKTGKAVCGMNSDLLDALLAGTAIVASSISIVELAKACQEIESACVDGIDWFVRDSGIPGQ